MSDWKKLNVTSLNPSSSKAASRLSVNVSRADDERLLFARGPQDVASIRSEMNSFHILPHITRHTHSINSALVMNDSRNAYMRRNMELSSIEQITAIHEAVRLKDVNMLNQRLSKCPFSVVKLALFEVPMQGNKTMLQVATSEGWRSGVELMLKFGLKVTAIDTMGTYNFSPLHTVTVLDLDNEILTFLLQFIECDILDHMRRTPLFYACENGNTANAKTLLNSGAQVNIFDENMLTPLHQAAKEGHVDVILLLLSHDAQVNPIHQFMGDSSQENTLLSVHTPLHMAIRQGHNIVVEILLQAGAEIDPAATYMMVITIPQTLSKALDALIQGYNMIKGTAYNLELDVHSGNFCLDLSFKALVLGPLSSLERTVWREACFHTELFLLHHIMTKAPYLLLHPICQTLIEFKWKLLRKFVYFYIFVHLLFLLNYCYYIYVFLSQLKLDRESNHEYDLIYNIKYHLHVIIAWVMLISMTLLIVILESLRVTYSYKKSYMDFEYILDLPIIASTPLLVPIFKDRQVWETILCAVVVVIISLKLIYVLGRFSWGSIYVMMFRKVSVTMMKIVFIYAWILFGFAASFSILLAPSEEDKRQFYHLHLLEVVAMFMGEFEIQNLFIEPEKAFKIGTCLIFCVFIMLIHIIMMNTMLGIPLYDIRSLKKEGQILWLCHLVQIMQQWESIIIYATPSLKFLRNNITMFKNDNYSLRLYPNLVAENNVEHMNKKEPRFSVSCLEKPLLELLKQMAVQNCRANKEKEKMNAINSKRSKTAQYSRQDSTVPSRKDSGGKVVEDKAESRDAVRIEDLANTSSLLRKEFQESSSAIKRNFYAANNDVLRMFESTVEGLELDFQNKARQLEGRIITRLTALSDKLDELDPD